MTKIGKTRQKLVKTNRIDVVDLEGDVDAALRGMRLQVLFLLSVTDDVISGCGDGEKGRKALRGDDQRCLCLDAGVVSDEAIPG